MCFQGVRCINYVMRFLQAKPFWKPVQHSNTIFFLFAGKINVCNTQDNEKSFSLKVKMRVNNVGLIIFPVPFHLF